MTKLMELVERDRRQRAGEQHHAPYRAVTFGFEREDWAVVDADGCVVYRGDARVAAMIASRLTRPGS